MVQYSGKSRNYTVGTLEDPTYLDYQDLHALHLQDRRLILFNLLGTWGTEVPFSSPPRGLGCMYVPPRARRRLARARAIRLPAWRRQADGALGGQQVLVFYGRCVFVSTKASMAE